MPKPKKLSYGAKKFLKKQAVYRKKQKGLLKDHAEPPSPTTTTVSQESKTSIESIYADDHPQTMITPPQNPSIVESDLSSVDPSTGTPSFRNSELLT
jgi:hypothetical protein